MHKTFSLAHFNTESEEAEKENFDPIMSKNKVRLISKGPYVSNLIQIFLMYELLFYS